MQLQSRRMRYRFYFGNVRKMRSRMVRNLSRHVFMKVFRRRSRSESRNEDSTVYWKFSRHTEFDGTGRCGLPDKRMPVKFRCRAKQQSSCCRYSVVSRTLPHKQRPAHGNLSFSSELQDIQAFCHSAGCDGSIGAVLPHGFHYGTG